MSQQNKASFGEEISAYEARQLARRERLLRIASKLQSEGNARYQRARQMAEAIPFGQPILVGHHSEGRDRRYRERIHNTFGKAFDAQNRAAALRAKAEAVGTGGISSDDPAAVQKLREELEAHEAKQARMKAVNAAHGRFLKNPASLDKSSLSDADKALVRTYKPQYSWEPHPFPPYSLQNLGANIRRIKGRIEELTRRAAVVEAAEQSGEAARETQCAGFRVVENLPANRVQVFFPGKPSEAVRSVLKRNGFRWSPSEGAWQRMLGGNIVALLTQANGYIRQQLEAA